jgi:hypothetical protein
MRFPALPGQEERTQRAREIGSIGTGSLARLIGGQVALLVFIGGLGLFMFGISNPAGKLFAVFFWASDLVFFWSAIPLIIEDRRQKWERKP